MSEEKQPVFNPADFQDGKCHCPDCEPDASKKKCLKCGGPIDKLPEKKTKRSKK